MVHSNQPGTVSVEDSSRGGEAEQSSLQGRGLNHLPTIKFLVGEERKPFRLPAKVVRRMMPSIVAALDTMGKEAQNTILIPQADPTTFKHLSEWALTTDIEVPPNNGGADSSIFWSMLSGVYILAEDLKVFELKRYVIQTLYASLKEYGYGPSSEIVRKIYVRTPVHSGLRRVIIAFFIWQAAEDWWNVDAEANDEDDWALKDMPEEFKTEVAIAALQRIHLMDDGNPFHDHDETAETGFGPNYFYDDDKAHLATQKWLRNDPDGLRCEEEWDAARFQVDEGTAADRAMVNDDETALGHEEEDGMEVGGLTKTGNDN